MMRIWDKIWVYWHRCHGYVRSRERKKEMFSFLCVTGVNFYKMQHNEFLYPVTRCLWSGKPPYTRIITYFVTLNKFTLWKNINLLINEIFKFVELNRAEDYWGLDSLSINMRTDKLCNFSFVCKFFHKYFSSLLSVDTTANKNFNQQILFNHKTHLPSLRHRWKRKEEEENERIMMQTHLNWNEHTIFVTKGICWRWLNF